MAKFGVENADFILSGNLISVQILLINKPLVQNRTQTLNVLERRVNNLAQNLLVALLY